MDNMLMIEDVEEVVAPNLAAGICVGLLIGIVVIAAVGCGGC